MANIFLRSTDGSDADSGATWALAKATLAGALAIATSADTIWVSQVHAETQATVMTLTLPTSQGLQILCGNDAAEPPTALATTATISTTGASTINFASGHGYLYGLTFSAGSAGNLASIVFGSASVAAGFIFDTCSFVLGNTAINATFSIGNGAAAGNDDFVCECIACDFKFGAVGQDIALRQGRIRLTGMTLNATGSIPTSLFTLVAGAPSNLVLAASDLSGRAFTNLFESINIATPDELVVQNCKLPASIVVVGTANTLGSGGPRVFMHNCDSADTNYRFAEHGYEGSVVQETAVIRTGGASNGTTSESHKMVSSANTQFWDPLVDLEIPFWNDTTGSAKTATIECITTDASMLTDAQCWGQVQYLGTSGVPLGTIGSDRAANILATPVDQAVSTVAWDSLVTARANLTAYSVGDFIKVASNAGRVFVCTTAGTTGVSEPAGFATAVDGDSVTDVTAVFRAMRRFKVAVTYTPQEKGAFFAKVMLAKVSTTLFVDPLVVVS